MILSHTEIIVDAIYNKDSSWQAKNKVACIEGERRHNTDTQNIKIAQNVRLDSYFIIIKT